MELLICCLKYNHLIVNLNPINFDYLGLAETLYNNYQGFVAALCNYYFVIAEPSYNYYFGQGIDIHKIEALHIFDLNYNFEKVQEFEEYNNNHSFVELMDSHKLFDFLNIELIKFI